MAMAIKEDRKIFCKLLGKEVNLNCIIVQTGRGETINQHRSCYENYKGKVRCKYTNNKECLEKTG